jgi:hypothetical protein
LRQRRDWFAGQLDLDTRLVFIDETLGFHEHGAQTRTLSPRLKFTRRRSARPLQDHHSLSLACVLAVLWRKRPSIGRSTRPLFEQRV